MRRELALKYSKLEDSIAELGEVVLAYSGGVDSTLLLKISYDILGDKVTAILGKSASIPESELSIAVKMATNIGVEPVIIETREIELPEYCKNSVERCYHCKKLIFMVFANYMGQNKLHNLIDGSNLDDLKDFRPGKKALTELGVLSPLKEAGFTKSDIRELSENLELPTWNKEAMACLATRIAYGEEITEEKLLQIENAEKYLRGLGFKNVRARLQSGNVKIETQQEQLSFFFNNGTSEKIIKKMKKLGFKSVSVDLEGYRMGSMNF